MSPRASEARPIGVQGRSDRSLADWTQVQRKPARASFATPNLYRKTGIFVTGPGDLRIPCCALDETLFAKKNSLLVGAGNWLKRRRTAAFSGQGSGLRAARIAGFPVKFPVCREFARRQVRSALRRQPRSHSLLDRGQF